MCTVPCMHMKHILHSAKFWRSKTLANRLFQSFGKGNVGKFTIANISYFSESGIWLGKILANDICFAKFTEVSLSKFCAIRYVATCERSDCIAA